MKSIFSLLLFASLLSGINTAYSQPVIQTDTVIQTSLCAGSSVIIPFTVIDTGGTFTFGNVFTAQLSDPFTGFSNPIDIGTFLIPWTGSGFILGTIPVNSPLLGAYKIRVIGDNPPIIGEPSPNFIIILNTAVLATIDAPDSMVCEGDSLELTATPIFQSYQWTRDGTNIPGTSFQTIKVTQAGTYIVTVIDTFQCESTSEPFTVYTETCVGIESIGAEKNGYTFYPNPVSGLLTVSSDEGGFSGSNLSIYNSIGQEVSTTSIEKGTKNLNIDVSKLTPGIYSIRFDSEMTPTLGNGRRFVKN